MTLKVNNNKTNNNMKTNKGYLKKAKDIREELDSYKDKITLKEWMECEDIHINVNSEEISNLYLFKAVALVRIYCELETGILSDPIKWWERLNITKKQSKKLKRFCKENNRW